MARMNRRAFLTYNFPDSSIRPDNMLCLLLALAIAWAMLVRIDAGIEFYLLLACNFLIDITAYLIMRRMWESTYYQGAGTYFN